MLCRLDHEPSVASVVILSTDNFWSPLQGSSLRTLDWSMGVMPGRLDYELTLIHFRHPSTKFDHFFSPKS